MVGKAVDSTVESMPSMNNALAMIRATNRTLFAAFWRHGR